MKRNKHISKKLIVKIALFAVIIVSALLIDEFIDDGIINIDTIENSAKTNINVDQTYFFNIVKPINLKSNTEQQTCHLFQRTQNKFLQKYHNTRAFFHFKSEKKIPLPPKILAFHFTEFNFHHFSNPDDLPPVV